MSPQQKSDRLLQLAEEQQPITDSIKVSLTVVEKVANFLKKYWYLIISAIGLFTAGVDWGIRQITKDDTQKNTNQSIVRLVNQKFDSLNQELRINAMKAAFAHRLERDSDNVQRANDLKTVKDAFLNDLDGKLSFMNAQIFQIKKAIKITDGYNEVKKGKDVELKPVQNK
jgi:hypothetical protein